MTTETPPTTRTVEQARRMWEQSGADLKAARSNLRRRDYLQSAFLSLQASINGLSAVCFLNGHFQLPAGSPPHLMALCAEADPRFAELPGTCPGLDEAMESNPFHPERDPAHEKALARQCREEGERVLKLVRGYLKDNRERFFAP